MSMREAMRERAREIEGAVCVTVCVCGVVRGADGRGFYLKPSTYPVSIQRWASVC